MLIDRLVDTVLVFPRVCSVGDTHSGMYPAAKASCFGHTRVCTRVPKPVILVNLGYISGY